MEDELRPVVIQIQKDLLTVQLIVESLVDELIDTNVVNKDKFSNRLDSKLTIIKDILDKMQSEANNVDTLLKSPMATRKAGQA